MKIAIQILEHGKDLPLPSYATEGAAGMDLRAAVHETVVIRPGERKLIPTGLSIAVPKGYEAQVRPRSGLALKQGVTMLNSPGTIDSDYRGEVGLITINHGEKPFEINRGDRLAQLLIAKVEKAEWELIDNLDETSRASGGFGHTGTH